MLIKQQGRKIFSDKILFVVFLCFLVLVPFCFLGIKSQFSLKKNFDLIIQSYYTEGCVQELQKDGLTSLEFTCFSSEKDWLDQITCQSFSNCTMPGSIMLTCAEPVSPVWICGHHSTLCLHTPIHVEHFNKFLYLHSCISSGIMSSALAFSYYKCL